MALRRTKPKTLKDRAQLGGQAAVGAAKAAGTTGLELVRTGRDRALDARKNPRGALEGGRKRAMAVAGTAAGAAGAFAFWRSRRDDRPPTHADPVAQPPSSATGGPATASAEESPADAPAAGATKSAATETAKAAKRSKASDGAKASSS